MTVAPGYVSFFQLPPDIQPVSRPMPAEAAAHAPSWGEDGLGFDDVLDAVNPLQHLPVVGTLYREYTGDQISPAAKMIGGLIFGGPVGLVLAVANAIFEEATGKDVGSTVMALLTGEADAGPAETA